MNKDYFQKIPKLKQQVQKAYQSYLPSMNQQFEAVKAQYTLQNCLLLEKILENMKKCKKLNSEHKKPIFKYFLQKQLKDRSFLHSRNTTPLRIIELTMVKLQEYSINWRDVYGVLIKEEIEIARNKCTHLQTWLKILKPYFDPQNPMEVVKELGSTTVSRPQTIRLYIFLFANICSETTEENFLGFLDWLIECYHRKLLIPQYVLAYFIKYLYKRKKTTLPNHYYKLFTEIILGNLLNQSSEKSVDFQFSRDNAIIVYHLIGKQNPYSISLLQKIFKVIKRNIGPFENSNKSLQFLYILIRWLWKRTVNQKNTKERLDKLIQKKRKAEEKAEKQKQEPEANDQNQKLEQAEQDQEDGENKQDEDYQKQAGDQQNIAKELLLQQYQPEPVSITLKIQKLQRVLKNQLTEEIIQLLRSNIEDNLLESIYFVQSKKTVPKILGHIFKFFPHLCHKSFDLLNKAANIDQINEDALILNIKVTVKFMFSNGMQKEGINRTLQMMDKIKGVKRIIDAWPIYQLLCEKLPLLDEQDFANVSEELKEQFKKNFQLDHDKFYESYSENVFEAFTRFLKQSQFFDENTQADHANAMYQLISNSHPFFLKRLLNQLISSISENPNAFALSTFTIYNKKLPSSAEEILLDLFKSLGKSDNENILLLQQNILLMLSHNLSLNQLSPHIRGLAKKNKLKPIYDIIRAKTSLDVQLDTIQPTCSSLSYFVKDPRPKLRLVSQLPQIEKYYKQIFDFFENLRVQLDNLVGEADLKQQKFQQVLKIVYESKQQRKNIEKRKNIYEILMLMGKIVNLSESMIVTIEGGALKFVDNPVIQAQIINGTFLNTIYKIAHSSQLIQDQKIPTALSSIITGEILKYYQKINQQKQTQSSGLDANKNQQVPNEWSPRFFLQSYIFKARVNLCSIMLNQQRNQFHFHQQIKDSLLHLLINPHCNQVQQIIQVFLYNGNIKFLVDKFVQFFKYSISLQNRFYQTRLYQIFQKLIKHTSFTIQQVTSLFQSHIAMIQTQDFKIKQISHKSYRLLTRVIFSDINSDLAQVLSLEKLISQYPKNDKTQIIWIECFYLIMNINPKKKTIPMQLKLKTQQVQIKNQNIIDSNDQQMKIFTKRMEPFLLQLQNLILSDRKQVRSAALIVHSIYLRKIKQLFGQYEQKQLSQTKYAEKQLQDFLKWGYLRPQHYEMNIKSKKNKRKSGPYTTYKVKKQIDFSTQRYQFLIENKQNATKFIANFHADIPSTPEQALSIFQNQNQNQLSIIFFRALEKDFNFIKLEKYSNAVLEGMIGKRFFKYLFLQDSKKSYKFFQNTKHYILKCIENLESLDNQYMILIYALELIGSYQKSYSEFGENLSIEEFLGKVCSEIIRKSSRNVFNKFRLTLFKKVENTKALNFLNKYCLQMIQSRKKLSRCLQMYCNFQWNDRGKHLKILKILLDQKIELESSTLPKIISEIIMFSQRLPINVKSVNQSGIINLERLKIENSIQKLSQNTYVAVNNEFTSYIITKLKQYINSNGIQLMKSAYNILNATLTSYIGSLVTDSNVETICCLITIGLNLINSKNQIQIDLKLFQNNIKNLFGLVLEERHFGKLLKAIELNVEGTKKNCQILNIISRRPIHFYALSSTQYVSFIKKIVSFNQNSIIYKQIISILSNLLFHCPIKFTDLLQQFTQKTDKCLLVQSHILGSLDLNQEQVQIALNQSTKEKRNLWARQMLAVRGKRQFLDQQKDYEIWKSIKQYSNPYHYHA